MAQVFRVLCFFRLDVLKFYPVRHAFVSGCQRHLNLVDFNKIYAARGRIINSNIAAATKPHTDKNLNLILGPHSSTNMSEVNRQTCPALAPCLMGNRSLDVSELTNHDDTETETKTQASAEGKDNKFLWTPDHEA